MKRPVDLNELADVVYDHERSITVIAKGMEDSNKIMSELVGEMKESRKETQEHYRRQDKLMGDNALMLKTLDSYHARFIAIEQRQNGEGCPTFNSFQQTRAAEVRRYEEKIRRYDKTMDIHTEDIDNMAEEITSFREKIKANTARIKHIEEAVKDTQKSAEDN